MNALAIWIKVRHVRLANFIQRLVSGGSGDYVGTV